jgi:hypothetical protein
VTRSRLILIVGLAAIVAPSLHLLSDVMEWSAGGFSRAQLLVNYAAFVPMPFLLLGLYALQTPRSKWTGLIGAVLYGLAFVYFTHSTLVALEQAVPDYETLWGRLGVVYTVHGALMIAGGLLFGVDALRARVLPRAGVILFLTGIGLNLAVGLTPLPDIVQIAGSTMRNVGLVVIGAGILRGKAARELAGW